MTHTLGESSSWLLWPDAPGVAPDAPDFECQDPANPASDIVDVHRPRVFAFRSGNPNGRAALVLAGGGYTKLVVSYEGVDVARWLNSLGFHAFLLVHRFPQARVLWMDASQLANHGLFPSPTVDAVISGLPLLTMSPRKVMAILSGAFTYVRAQGGLYQFTYGRSRAGRGE